MTANASKSESLFEERVDETMDSLGEEASGLTGKKAEDRELLDKLRAIALKEGFEVERLLGRGGMGAVVSARDRELGRFVALKFLVRSSASPQQRAKLKREAERLSSLVHENIVQVYSWHSVGQLTFFSMEYVDGQTLYHYVKQHGELRPAEALRIIAEASAGVAAAHDAGILHRDIKPQNIMISKTGRVKVTDFGLASDVEETSASGGRYVVSGTVGFMAPEQARGEEQSFTTDVFGLAATFYYALTGELPFEASPDVNELLDANRRGKIKPLFAVRDDLPQPIYRVVARGLSRDSYHRFADARVFRQALEEAILNLDEKSAFQYLRSNLRKALMRYGFLIGLIIGTALGFCSAYYFFAF